MLLSMHSISKLKYENEDHCQEIEDGFSTCTLKQTIACGNWQTCEELRIDYTRPTKHTNTTPLPQNRFNTQLAAAPYELHTRGPL
jgi:hypothetical protein